MVPEPVAADLSPRHGEAFAAGAAIPSTFNYRRGAIPPRLRPTPLSDDRLLGEQPLINNESRAQATSERVVANARQRTGDEKGTVCTAALREQSPTPME
jgi:hypothetical protein